MAKTSTQEPVEQKPPSDVEGAVPYRPSMTKTEALDEIQKASGDQVRMHELRGVLPVARTRQMATKTGSDRGTPVDSVLAGAPRGGAAPVPGAGAGPAAGAAAGAALTTAQRETVIDQALLMLDAVYANLPLKRALHAIDPIQRLQLLRLRHEALDERGFQSEMIDIFVGLRDLHTNYILPRVYWAKFAYLPFRIEEYYEGQERRYLVSWVSPRSTDPRLKPGLEVTHWNGSPIDLAVARNAAREAGSNADARRARGLEALSLRWFGSSLPPDEDWVTLTYIDGAETIESRFDWQVVERDDLAGLLADAGGDSGSKAAGLGIDVKTELLRRVRKALFDAPALKAEDEVRRHRASGARSSPRADMSMVPDVYPRFGPVTTPSGSFGYIRLATFAPEGGDVEAAVAEFVRILRTLPPRGLILDVRGNGGGYINFGERILQTLTPRPITPEPFHFVSTPLTLRIAESIDWLAPWAGPLATALAIGAGFSQGFPLTDPAASNDIGQVYQGPVVLITDAFCYSTTDIFAAGFQDHAVGVILGCHDNTGAGGANVWDYAELLQRLPVAPNPFVALPAGVGMRVAVRRSTRVGDRSGVPLEDLGVVPDQRYYMTRRDLLEHNADLIARAAQILAAQPRQELEIAAVGAAPLAQVRITSAGIDRVDLFSDDRPVVSQDVAAGPATIALPRPLAAGSRLEARGFRGGGLVASARLVA